ncbi:hypothetical protein AMECASPLE_023190 [Ameca splendens]|uniref:Uncharacterized protein n=1 Tax=Ameca splendens TaxID=208324 RepID=A0ABV0YQY3_9TELE
MTTSASLDKLASFCISLLITNMCSLLLLIFNQPPNITNMTKRETNNLFKLVSVQQKRSGVIKEPWSPLHIKSVESDLIWFLWTLTLQSEALAHSTTIQEIPTKLCSLALLITPS